MTVQLITPETRDIALQELPVLQSKSYPLRPFDERTIHFFDTLSKRILAEPGLNRLPEMVALAFWIRKTNLNRIREENSYLSANPGIMLSPVGTVLHICPANVDTMFIYSMVVSVLMGNKNILRISERMEGAQIKSLFRLLNALLAEPEHHILYAYINLVSYGHNAEVSTFLSQKSQARVIWGGNQTINTFRDFKPGARTRDINFADRVSVAVISCSAFNLQDHKEQLQVANRLFNDAYTFDQKGCSSPQTIYFSGDKPDFDTCATQLQKLLAEIAAGKYETDIASLASLKLNQMVEDSLEQRLEKKLGDNYATLALLTEAGMNEKTLHSCGGGYFYARHLPDVSAMEDIIDVSLQTVAYYGLDAAELSLLKDYAFGVGIDRIVPLGSALDFHYIWDGYNLLEALSRKVFVK